MSPTAPQNSKQTALPPIVVRELEDYEVWIKRFLAREIGDVKMQKIRLQLGTYAQRQDGVQMQRIKFPGGIIRASQLSALADTADQFASGVIHFTTREDAQLYYIQLDKCPDMMRALAQAGITTREACGNTVRNITASSRSGITANEAFDVIPYAEALFRFLMRNKFNQVMGRKFKIAFDSSPTDYAGLLFHDLGFMAVTRPKNGVESRGFRVYIGGGLGGVPAMGFLYSEFLPQEEMLSFTSACVRLFDRYGERKNRMAARMKFLVKKMGWEAFKKALDEERAQVKLPAAANDYLKTVMAIPAAPPLPQNLPANPAGVEKNQAYQAWRQDNVVSHKFPAYAGVNVRLKLGDLESAKARKLAHVAEVFSNGELRITIEQNLLLSWVPAQALPAVYQALAELGLADAGAETLEDTTTCPGADTCRLGITSAKGLGAGVSEAMHNGMKRFKDLTRQVRVKVSGCPNNCAQHSIASIGFQGAALKKDGKTVPAHEVFVGGQVALDRTHFGERIGKIPAKNGPKVVEAFIELYAKEKRADETFSDCMLRLGRSRLQEVLAPFQEIPSFDEKPDFYLDWGHGNEKFVTRTGIKGECAGTPIQEKVPVMTSAKEHLAQAEALLTHREYANAQIEAYETIAAAARVPLYVQLVDPFTSEQAIWEFENVFVRAGRADKNWLDMAEKLDEAKLAAPSEANAQALIQKAKQFVVLCETLHVALLAEAAPKNNSL